MPSPTPKRKHIKLHDFGGAMRAIKKGHKVTRVEWENEKEYGLLTLGWLCIHHAKDPEAKFHTWKVNEGDLVAEDWIIIR